MSGPAQHAPHAAYGYRALLRLARPVVITRASFSVVGFCDGLMIAPLGENALAAVTAGSMNVFALTVFPMGVLFIVQSFSAQLSGQARHEAIVRYAWYGLGFAAISSVVALGSIPWVPDILGQLPFSESLQGPMSHYVQLRAWGVPAFLATEALGNVYGGLGHPNLQMRASVVSMFANIVLNFFLIEGRAGAPALGIAGAAWASVAARWLGFFVIALPFARKVHLPVERIRPHALRWAEFVRVLRFGTPAGINWFLEFGAFLMFVNLTMASLGTTVLAAVMLVLQTNSVSFMPAFGISSAGAILAGQAIGAGAVAHVRDVLRRTLIVTMGWQVSVGMFYILFPRTLIGWFEPGPLEGSRLVEIGTTMLLISAAWQLFDAIAMSVTEILRAAGDTSWTMWARFFAAWFFFVPGAYATVHFGFGGYAAAMWWAVAYLALLSILCAGRYLSGRWRDIQLVEPEARVGAHAKTERT